MWWCSCMTVSAMFLCPILPYILGFYAWIFGIWFLSLRGCSFIRKSIGYAKFMACINCKHFNPMSRKILGWDHLYRSKWFQVQSDTCLHFWICVNSSGYILYIPLKWWVVLLKSWIKTSTDQFRNSTSSSVTSSRISSVTYMAIHMIDLD